MRKPALTTLIVNVIALVGVLMITIDVAQIANDHLGLSAAGLVFIAAAFVLAGVIDTLNDRL